MFLDNKYQRIYFALMRRALGRQEVEGEKHHVIPRSLGGTNSAENLVLLTYREHFLAHWLLPKFTEGKDRDRMFHALSYLQLCPGTAQRGEIFNASWRFELSRKAARKARLGRKMSAEARAKMSAAKRGWVKPPASQETREKFSAYWRGRPKSDEQKQKISDTLRGKTLSDEHKEAIRAGLKLAVAEGRRVVPIQSKEQLRAIRLGKKNSAEHKKKTSESLKVAYASGKRKPNSGPYRRRAA